MSFILDALKKLENKRRQESVPDLMTVHTPDAQRPEKRSLWPYFILAALLLNTGVLMAWLKPWGPDDHKTAVQSTAGHTPSADNVLSDAVKGDAALTASASPSEQGKGAVTSRPQPGKLSSEPDNSSAPIKNDRVNNKAIRGTDPDNIDNKEITAAAGPDDRDDEPASVAINPTAEELDSLRHKIREERSVSANTSFNSDEEPAAVPKPVSEFVELSDLPLSVRDSLPEIKINGHIFSDNPSSRLANINGMMIREGDSVVPGLRVIEITMTGIVFDYQDVRFYMRAF